MALQFTTFDNIARRLRGRLQVSELQPITLGGQTVDPALVDQYGEQVEDYIRMMLGHIYELPLRGTHPYLSDIAECLIIAKILETHYQGGSFGAPATDVGGMAMDLARQGEFKLQRLMPQERRTDPSIPPTAEPLVLDGETMKARTRDTITRNVTVVGDRNLGSAASNLQWPGADDLFNTRARGAYRLWNGRRITE
jgi:hypothetical protein